MLAELAALSAYVRDRYGVVSLAELAVLEISAAQRKAMSAWKLLIPMHRGVYRVASVPSSLHGRCRGSPSCWRSTAP